MPLQKVQRVTSARRGVIHPPRSRAFFLELLFNMLIFAFCASVALQMFAEGKQATDESAALITLSLEAKTLAESYKVSDGVHEDLFLYANGEKYTGDTAEDGTLIFRYAKDFSVAEAEYTHYCLIISKTTQVNDVVHSAEITAYAGEEELFSFTVMRYHSPEGRW